MIPRLIKKHFDLPVYLLWMLLTALIFDLSTINGDIISTDDEFAEFEDPDDTFTVDLAEPAVPSDRSKPPDRSHSNSDDKNRSPVDNKEAATMDDEIIVSPLKAKPIPTPSESDADSTVEIDEFENISPKMDDEEFEGLPTTTNSQSKASGSGSGGKPSLKIAKVPHHLSRSWDTFHLEMLFLLLLMIYFSNYAIGRAKNTQIAMSWFTSVKPVLAANFAIVGDDGLAEPGTGTIMKESEHLYSLWCSGRIYCEAMLVELRLHKRQCLLFTLISWLRPSYDSIIAKVIMEDSEMDGWVMAVGRKRRLQALAKDHQDLAFFCPDKRGQRHPDLPESFTVLNEIPEAMNGMLNPPVCKFLTENEDRIDYLFFSDQYTGPKPPQDETPSAKLPVTQKVLIFAFRIGNNGNINSSEISANKSLFQFIFYIVEKVHRLRLSKESKVKSERNRQRARDSRLKSVHSQRQEAAQSRREERMRAVKERIMSEEDPDKARKLEEREQRKEKAKKMRVKMLKPKGP